MNTVIESENENNDQQWTADRIAGLVCVRRESGAWCHVFVDHGNRCQCGEVDLNAYRNMVLQ